MLLLCQIAFPLPVTDSSHHRANSPPLPLNHLKVLLEGGKGTGKAGLFSGSSPLDAFCQGQEGGFRSASAPPPCELLGGSSDLGPFYAPLPPSSFNPLAEGLAMQPHEDIFALWTLPTLTPRGISGSARGSGFSDDGAGVKELFPQGQPGLGYFDQVI